MLNDEICRLRERLNESIIEGDDYKVTYKLSVELDELIAEYYKNDIIMAGLNRHNLNHSYAIVE